MKIDFSRTINDLNDRPLAVMDGDMERALTLRDVCSNALLYNEANVKTEGREKQRRLRLAVVVFAAKEPIELTAQEVVMLKEQVAKSSGALVSGRAWDLLDPSSAG